MLGWVGGKVSDGGRNKSNCPPFGHIVNAHGPQRYVRKTFSTYFVTLSQWKITLNDLTENCEAKLIFFLSFCLEEILQWLPLLNEVNAWKRTCEKQRKSTTDQLLNFKYEN